MQSRFTHDTLLPSSCPSIADGWKGEDIAGDITDQSYFQSSVVEALSPRQWHEPRGRWSPIRCVPKTVFLSRSTSIIRRTPGNGSAFPYDDSMTKNSRHVAWLAAVKRHLQHRAYLSAAGGSPGQRLTDRDGLIVGRNMPAAGPSTRTAHHRDRIPTRTGTREMARPGLTILPQYVPEWR